MRKLIVGNWKMHGFVTMAHPLVESVLTEARNQVEKAQVVLCPPFVLIPRLAGWLAGTVIKIGGQDCHVETHGAYTGDISAPMLVDADCSYVIVGHSERRLHNGETNAIIRSKAASAIKAGLTPIICVGETARERDAGKAKEIVGQQVRECLPDEAAGDNFVLAYEPVWAIGSGQTPSGDDIAHMHAYIISVVSGVPGLADEPVTLLYGGSVNVGNALAIMATEGVSGVLVGGASLKAEDFTAILRAAAAAQDPQK